MKPALRIICLFLSLALAFAAGMANAQNFPNRPVKFVTGNAPGGGTDTIARMVTPKLGERLGHPVIVENRPGADGIIGAEYVAKSDPDGYTIFVGTDGQMVLNVGLYKKLPYDPVSDFAPISRISSTPVMIVVHPSLPVHTIKELIALAKAKPGELFYASGAPVFRVTTEMFKAQTGTNIVHVPFKGTSPAITATMAGSLAIAEAMEGNFRVQSRPRRVSSVTLPSLSLACRR